MPLKRIANIVSAVAGIVLLLGGAAFLIVSSGKPDQPPGEDRILNVGIGRDSTATDSGLAVTITVNPDGAFVIDGAVMADEELVRKLKTLARVAPKADVRVNGAAETSWDAMIRAVDLIETTGLTNVTFATRKPLPE